MATQLQIVNDVLRRLRETQVSSVASNEYSELVGSFVNDAKETLEDMWFWTVNETEIDLSILADGTRNYEVAGTNDRSFLVRSINDQIPMAYDVTTNDKAQLCDIPLKALREFRNSSSTIDDAVDQPTGFALKPDADGRGWSVELYQGSGTARTWRFYWYAPQGELAVDGSDDNTQVLLPKRPVYLRALYYAQYERGEAQPGGIEEKRAHAAAAAAMELDMQTHKKSDQKDITNLESLRNHFLLGS